MKNMMTRFWFLWIVVLAGCATAGLEAVDTDKLFGKSLLVDRRSDFNTDEAAWFREQVKPVLDQRCVVCHACNDAPCQLKLTSPEGIMRGAIASKVYNGTRLTAAEPTRLGIDASSTAGWRKMGFHPVLNERTQTPDVNLANSVMYQMLALKKNTPTPGNALLSDDYDLSLNREQSCPTREEFTEYSEEHPHWGMPYGLPQISDSEYDTLVQWLRAGSPMSAPEELPTDIAGQIRNWEDYFNDDILKQQLASRYMYEHLFLANLYFSEEPLFRGIEPKERPAHFFKLVRSYTPPGIPIKIVDTRRPYDDPGVQRIYYRLQRIDETIVAKTHMPYRLNAERMAWMKELFNEPDYTVNALPGYEVHTASNPFIAFHDLPVKSRYRFMLEEAEYIIRGFIKGPVCRGQVALNVIDDHFWAVFTDPDTMRSDDLADFLSEQSNNLRLPGEAESNAEILVNWLKYSELHGKYLEAKNERMQKRFPDGRELDLDLIWDGDGHNPNAALTIMRHFDSSSVEKGFIGQPTKTAWVVDYPLLERIHYLLVTEFDVYGNVGHQLMTRLYMDFLRMEGEHNFLTFLPQKERIELAEYWYRDASDEVDEFLVNYEDKVLTDPGINFQTQDKKVELYGLLKQRLKGATSTRFELASSVTPSQLSTLLPINNIQGKHATLMPEISYVMIDRVMGEPQLFTLLRASGHSNLTGLLYEENNRLPEEDYLTIVPGILGTYPAAIYNVPEYKLDDFIDGISTMESEDDYKEFAGKFAIRRTNPHFWKYGDKLHSWFRKDTPLNYGILDFARLENR